MLGKNVNVGEWVKSIIEQLNFGPLVCADLGISFTAERKGEVTYMYCPKSGASFSEAFENRESALKWADSLMFLDDQMELMALSYLTREFGEFFKESNWTGRTPIALHLWIQK